MADSQLYTELVMWHNRSGHNHHELNAATHAERGHNPNCGDDLTLQLRIEGDVVADAAFLGTGCAISQASMSMMIDLVKGKPLSEAQALCESFLKMIRGEALSEGEHEALGDTALFENLSKMPARVKCGTLGWHCLEVILEDRV